MAMVFTRRVNYQVRYLMSQTAKDHIVANHVLTKEYYQGIFRPDVEAWEYLVLETVAHGRKM